MNKNHIDVDMVMSEMANFLNTHNQRYLDHLKESGDLHDMRSRVLAKILDSAADGIIVLDDKLTIVLANQSAADMAGWQLEDVTRDELRRNYKFYSDEGYTELPHDQEPIVVALREKRPYELVGYVVSPHLPQPGRWVRVHAAPMFDEKGNALGGVTVFYDLTERMKLQRQRDSLAALITHDIKNHFAAEQMFFDMLDLESFDTDTLEILDSLRQTSNKYLQLSDSLLEMFRSNFFAGKEFGQDIEILEITNRAIELSRLYSVNHAVKLKVTAQPNLPKVRGLPSVISHVLHNLIVNAIEASEPKSEVTVDLSFDDACVFIKVTDRGIGMDCEEVAKLFSPFRVAKQPQGSDHSSGFGLYLSYMLIEGQGGDITCDSRPDSGTTLTVRLPALSS